MSDTNTNTHSTLYLIKRFAPYFHKYKGILALDLFAASLTTLCEMALPIILRYIANTGSRDISLLSTSLIVRLGIIFLILRIIDTCAFYYMANIGHVMGAYIETDMRHDAFEHLQKLSDSYYNNTKVGQIMARITSDLFDVTEFAHHCPEEFFIGGLKIIISFCILININISLTLSVFAVIPIMIISVSTFNHKMKSAFSKQRSHIGELNSNIEEALLGVKVVKSFANEHLEQSKFNKNNEKFLSIKKTAYKYLAGFGTTSKIFDGIMYLIVIIYGGILLMNKVLSAGDLLAYTLYVTTLLATVRRIVDFMEQFQRGMTGIERFVEIIDTDIEIFDNKGATELINPKGTITLDNVSFEYPDDNNSVLHNINLTVRQGENIALVGPSGGGKTTLSNLIPRFYDVTKGRITIDGQDIRTITLQSLRSNIGMVQQDVYLFSGTVFQNIEYGLPGATFEQVKLAAIRAGAYEFILELRDGFDTYVGERGVKLSGGQKQRISIARVFLKNPPILILDEATSALDNQSEQWIQQSLQELSKGRTTFTIAHRLSTIRHANRILVLNEGRITEAGSHDELMSKKELYYNLYTGGLLSSEISTQT